MFWWFKFELVKEIFDDGSGWLENHTLMKKEQTIKKGWKQKNLTYEKTSSK